MKAGFTSLQTNFNGFRFTDPATDLAFAENINVTKPNMGAGAYYFTDKYCQKRFGLPNFPAFSKIDKNLTIKQCDSLRHTDDETGMLASQREQCT